MYYQVTLVPVPLSLRRDLDWQDKAPAHRLAALVSRLVGAPHLDLDDALIEDLLCRAAGAVGELRRNRRVLPEPEKIRDEADRLVSRHDTGGLVELATALKLDRRPLRCEVRSLETELRELCVAEVARLLLRAATPPPKRRRPRDDAA